MMRSICLYHRNCADGVLSAGLLALSTNLKVCIRDFVEVDYEDESMVLDQIIEIYKEGDVQQLVLADFSFDAQAYVRLQRECPNLKIMVYDHHPRSLEVKTDGMLVNYSKPSTEGSSALQICKEFDLREYETVATSVSNRDTWQGQQSEDHFVFHELFYDRILAALNSIVKTPVSVVSGMVGRPAEYMMDLPAVFVQAHNEFKAMSPETRQAILSNRNDMVKMHILTQSQRLQFTDKRGNELNVVMMPGFRCLDSKLCAMALELFEDMDMVIAVRPHLRDTLFEYSVRSRKTGMDIRPFVRALGGDGHSAAAGFRNHGSISPFTSVKIGLATLWLLDKNKHDQIKHVVLD